MDKEEKGGPLLLLLRLDEYKREACRSDCGRPDCAYFHGSKDRRRPFNRSGYAKQLCPSHCLSPRCDFAVNFVEQKYHPANYKRKACREALQPSGCPYRQFCAAAHDERELRPRPLHLLPVDLGFLLFALKSEFCPFAWLAHDAAACVYAHNWQDFKRPFAAGRLARQCPAWSRRRHVADYAAACAAGFACRLCHGWKELQFHPDRLKRACCRKCPPESGAKRQLCGFRHADEPEWFAGLDLEHFDLAPPSLDFRAVSTRQFLRSVSPGPLPPEPARPDIKNQTLIADCFVITARAAQRPDQDCGEADGFCHSDSPRSQYPTSQNPLDPFRKPPLPAPRQTEAASFDKSSFNKQFSAGEFSRGRNPADDFSLACRTAADPFSVHHQLSARDFPPSHVKRAGDFRLPDSEAAGLGDDADSGAFFSYDVAHRPKHDDSFLVKKSLLTASDEFAFDRPECPPGRNAGRFSLGAAPAEPHNITSQPFSLKPPASARQKSSRTSFDKQGSPTYPQGKPSRPADAAGPAPSQTQSAAPGRGAGPSPASSALSAPPAAAPAPRR